MTTIATKYPFVGSIDTRQGGRTENQDNAGFVDTPLGLLVVVCDGMGGGPGGRTASLMAVDTILNVISEVSEHTHREDAMRFAIAKANDIIYAKAQETPELRGMGTTVAAILINEDSAVIAHAGDTRIYQLRKGTIVFRSSDHSVVANLVRQNKITEEEARNHPRSNVVTRALGIRPSIEIEFDEVTFHRGDRFVLCSDGVWGMMPQRDLVKSLSQPMGIEELTSSITEEIDYTGQVNGGGHDNLTLAVIDTSFDSVLKKIKKKTLSDITINSNEKKTKNNHKAWNIFILLLIIIVAISIWLIFGHGNYEFKAEKVEGGKNTKGITTTTVKYNAVRSSDCDSSNHYSVCQNNQVIPRQQNEMENPFQDSTIIRGRKQEITRQIKLVVNDLDNLKTIREKNKKKTEDRKRSFVKNVIKPDVNQLRNKVVDEKKKDVKDILNLLNDKRTVLSDKYGQTTNDSKKHIDNIKTKVRGLQN